MRTALLATTAFALLTLSATAQEPCTPDWQNLGGGSFGSQGVPRLEYSGSPVVGAPLRFRVSHGRPFAHGCVGFSAFEQTLPLPFFDAVARIGFPLFALELFDLDDEGRSPWQLETLPVTPDLCGVTFVAQGMVDDPDGPGGATFTNARRVTVGEAAARPQFPGQVTRIPGQLSDFVTGDFDADGTLDVVVSARSNPPIHFLAGLGNGVLAEPISTTDFGISAIGTAAGDFDGDGCLDVAVANRGLSNDVRVYFGACDGTFPTSIVVDGGFLPDNVEAADIDGDGALDLITNGGLDTIQILRGDGRGTFSSPDAHVVGVDATEFIVVDFTGDGILDIVTNGFLGTGSGLLVGSGRGAFRVATALPTGNPGITSIGVADFDENGLLDLCYARSSGLTVDILRQTSPSTFASVATNTIGLAVRGLDVGDFDGDGHVDAVGSDWMHGDVLLMRGDGTGRLSVVQRTAASSGPQRIRLVDLHGDGQLDVVVGSNSNAVTVVEGTDAGALRGQERTPVGLTPRGLAKGDWNGDGFDDVAVGEEGPGTVSFLVSDGTGALTPSDVAPSVGSTRRMTTAHVDLDLDLDLIVLDHVDDQVVVYRGGAGSQFESPLTIPSTEGPVDVAVGDFDGNGRSDLAVICNHGAGFVPKTFALQIYLGRDTGGLESPFLLPVADEPIAIAVGDFDGDGDDDIAIAHDDDTFDDTFSLYLGDGGGGFGTATTWKDLETHNPVAMEAADMNGDGFDDVVVAANYATAETVVLLGAPGGALQIASNVPISPVVWDLDVGDLDGDGILDHATVNRWDDEIAIHFGVGDGTFDRSTIVAAGHAASQLVLVDLTDDGLLDLLIATQGNLTLTLIENGLFGQQD